MSKKWVERWHVWTAEKPIRPGVWRRREGGFLVRGKANNPRTGKREQVFQVLLTTEDPDKAKDHLEDLKRKIRSGGVEATTDQTVPLFSDFAASHLERKVAVGDIKSGKSLEVWKGTLANHLIPAFGHFYIDQIRFADVEEWKAKMGAKVLDGKYSPVTVNDWLKYMHRIMGAACAFYLLERNPMSLVKDLDTSEHPTYTEEEPNSLTAEEVPPFMDAMARLFPQHFAMTTLGFSTGLRPSHMRPLRRSGPTADLTFDPHKLRIRRSHTAKVVMNRTKTALVQTLSLPEELVEILRWHIAELEKNGRRQQKTSELLFPAVNGLYRANSVLDKPFAVVAAEIKLGKKITARGMRRTYMDLCRAAGLEASVTRSISGHATDKMKEHYETIGSEEQRASLAKVVSLAGFRSALAGAKAAV